MFSPLGLPFAGSLRKTSSTHKPETQALNSTSNYYHTILCFGLWKSGLPTLLGPSWYIHEPPSSVHMPPQKAAISRNTAEIYLPICKWEFNLPYLGQTTLRYLVKWGFEFGIRVESADQIRSIMENS